MCDLPSVVGEEIVLLEGAVVKADDANDLVGIRELQGVGEL